MTTSVTNALPVRNPRTALVDFELVPATAAEVTTIAGNLRRAQGNWAAAGVACRAEVLRRWADAIEKDAALISAAEMVDTGRKRVAYELPYMVAAAVRGGSRMGPNGLLRFLRRKALITRAGAVLDMDMPREDAARS